MYIFVVYNFFYIVGILWTAKGECHFTGKHVPLLCI